MRHSTPDLDFYIQLYLGILEDVTLLMFYSRIRHIRKETPHPCVFMNKVLSMWGHQFNYNQDYLKKIWDLSGFVIIRRVSVGESRIPELTNLESHSNTEWFKSRATLVMEAQKPL
ncbi:MAG: hypothetical protein QME75_15875 [Deltaproteobacteria bacterium]|nr:hypothetical protein [Deltaproteobacteria bacterium]